MVLSQKNPIPVFIHIPKTAGTTLNLVVKRQYNPNNIVSIHTPQKNIETVSELRSDRLVQIN